ncbi:MAG: NfeD family protein [Subdoligranulum sp.]|nr:NfeD family protein [Subdoligranulum sp.]
MNDRENAAHRAAERQGNKMVFTVNSILWLMLLIALIVFEAVTVNLVSIWFAVGAASAFVTSAFTDSGKVQFIVFVLVSVVALLITRPLARRYQKERGESTNVGRNVGRKGQVLVEISPNVPGRVRLDGVDWMARSETPIADGTLCEVLAVEGASLVVRPVAVEEAETAQA